MGANPGGGGGGRGDVSPPPPRFFRWGTQYQMFPPPPPPPRFGGRMNFGRYNVVFCLFFFFCLSEMFVMWVGYPYTFWLARLSTQMALRKKKGSESPPPPPISFFGLALPLGLSAVGENVSVPPPPPPQSASDLRPCASGSIESTNDPKPPKVTKMHEITDYYYNMWWQFKIGIQTHSQIHNTVRQLDDMTTNVKLKVYNIR